jgi:hypothetical protein
MRHLDGRMMLVGVKGLVSLKDNLKDEHNSPDCLTVLIPIASRCSTRLLV